MNSATDGKAIILSQNSLQNSLSHCSNTFTNNAEWIIRATTQANTAIICWVH